MLGQSKGKHRLAAARRALLPRWRWLYLPFARWSRGTRTPCKSAPLPRAPQGQRALPQRCPALSPL